MPDGHAHRLRLLGNDAVRAHARNRVDFDQVGALSLDDEIDPHHAAAVERFIGRQGHRVHFADDLRVERGRGDLFRKALVFGVVIEKFGFAYQFGDREQVFSAAGDQYAATDFASLDILFDQHVIALGECLLDRRQDLIRAFDFRYAETAAAGVRFDEQRQAQFAGNGSRVDFRIPADQNFPRQVDACSGESPFAGRFVERDDRCDESARRVGDFHHVEVSLQASVLAGGAVNQDQRIVRSDLFAFSFDREVFAIQFRDDAVLVHVVPAAVVQDDFVDVVFGAVEILFDQRGSFECDLPFGRFSSGDQCDVFHKIRV